MARPAGSPPRGRNRRDAGRFEREIAPITVGSNGDSVVVTADEGIRRDTTAERLAGLRPAFQSEDWSERFPQIGWVVTAGNSSQISDGAAAVLIASPQAAERLGLVPRARFHSFAVVGDDPIMLLTGVIPATRRVLDRAGLGIIERL